MSSRAAVGGSVLSWALGFLVPIALFVTWEAAFRLRWVPQTQLAPPTTVVPLAFTLLARGGLGTLVLASATRLLIGMALGLVGGVATGAAAARFRPVAWAINPTIGVLAPIPVVEWIPFVILALGTSQAYQISLVALTTFLLAHLYTFTATTNVRRLFSPLADMYEMSYPSRFRYLYLPRVLPEVLTAMRVSAIIGWIVLFLVEFGSSEAFDSGLAFFIRHERAMGRIEDALAGVLILALVAFVVDFGLVLARKWLERWVESGVARAL